MKIFKIALVWIATILAYILLANIFPAFTSIASQGASDLAATSNMSNYPGSLQVVQSSPLWIWFIPGGVAIVATAVFLKQDGASK